MGRIPRCGSVPLGPGAYRQELSSSGRRRESGFRGQVGFRQRKVLARELFGKTEKSNPQGANHSSLGSSSSVERGCCSFRVRGFPVARRSLFRQGRDPVLRRLRARHPFAILRTQKGELAASQPAENPFVVRGPSRGRKNPLVDFRHAARTPPAFRPRRSFLRSGSIRTSIRRRPLQNFLSSLEPRLDYSLRKESRLLRPKRIFAGNGRYVFETGIRRFENGRIPIPSALIPL